MVAGFTRVRLGCRWVHPEPFIRGRWGHSVSPLGSLGSFEVIGFTRVRAGGRRVHPVSLV